MSTPAFFKDFNKPVDTVLNDDYSYKKNLKVKFTTSNGVTITSENELVDGKDVKAKVSGKYKHAPTGFSVDKLQLKETGGIVTEISLANLAKGLNLTFKGEEKPTAELGVEYAVSRFAGKAEVDLINLSGLKASAVAAHEGFKVGGEFEAKLPSGEKSALEVAKWKAGAGYGTTAFFASVLAAKGKSGLDYSAYGLYSVSGPVKVGASATLSGGAYKATIGGVYKCNPKTTIKAKADLDAVGALTVVHDVLPKVQLTVSSQINLKTFSEVKTGLGATLG